MMMKWGSGRVLCSNRRLARAKSKRSLSRIMTDTSIGIAFSPLGKAPEPGEEEYSGILRKRREADFLKKRQIFVRSYRFTIKRSVAEKVKASFRRVKVAACRIFACKYRNSLALGLKRCERTGNRCVAVFRSG